MSNRQSVVYRKDYKAPNHDVETINLVFDLIPDRTIVTSTMHVVPKETRESDEFELDGESLQLVSIKINGQPSLTNQYAMNAGKLIFHSINQPTDIEIVTQINPKANLELSGLYLSNNNFITQCEAEGFRRITFFPDRPDVLAKYTVTLHAPKECKVLLSNGNLIDQGALPDGRKYAVWHDPFPKPSYLFALVAGNFIVNEETIELNNGKPALLQIYTEPGNENKTIHAMECLKKAIRWDEVRYGLTLDLERFMIVATNDFNMGAMENKGLNIFNAKYVLADDRVATDSDYSAIESVIGHEYFHNWTGDRITCRDWFQLSLKEGLTVFREQEFASDMLGSSSAKVVKRIKDVRALRTAQFPEDAGPMAHPIRPDSYSEINNFSTMTVYEKGAEVVRMYQTMFGKEGFKRGLAEYIRRYDGTAATCDDFRNAMAEANNANLSQFALWYSQAGTPRVTVKTHWEEDKKTFTITAKQSNRTLPGQPKPQPLMIPIVIGVLNDKGEDIPLQLEGEERPVGTNRVLILNKEEQTWTLINVERRPLLSLGRGFSAPVIFDMDLTRDQLVFLAKNDSDLFNRAEAFEKLSLLAIDAFLQELRKTQNPNSLSPMEAYLATFEEILNDESLSPAYRAEILKLPSEQAIYENQVIIEPALIRQAWQTMQKKIGQRLKTSFEDKVKTCTTEGIYKFDADLAGKRALKFLSLSYLVASGNPKGVQQTRNFFEKGNNITDKIGALKIAVQSGLPIRQEMLNKSSIAWATEPLLINKWLEVQALATSVHGEMPVVDKVRALMMDPLFSIKNPNNVYSLLRTFFAKGGPEFHTFTGSGYQLWIETVLKIDSFNPQVAARLARSLENWRRYEPRLASMMYKALRYVSQQKNLSEDLREIVDKAINEPI